MNRKSIRNRIISIVLSIVMVVGAVPLPGLTLMARAEEIALPNSDNYTAHEDDVLTDFTHITSYVDADGEHDNVVATPLDNTMIALDEGTYVVDGNVEYSATVNFNGPVILILEDGASMSAPQIMIGDNAPLTIYGQSDGTGTLTVTNSNSDGIVSQSDITINGGTINATSIHSESKNITLNGGTITAGSIKSDTSRYSQGKSTITLGGATVKSGSYDSDFVIVSTGVV